MLHTCISDIARFHARLDKLCIIGDIGDVERRIYDGLVVDGYEFGHGVVSQMNSSIFLSMGQMWETI